MLRNIALAEERGVPRANLKRLFQDTVGEAAADEAFAGLVTDLENDFYVRQRRETDSYLFASRILCDWWRRYYAF